MSLLEWLGGEGKTGRCAFSVAASWSLLSVNAKALRKKGEGITEGRVFNNCTLKSNCRRW